MIRQFSFLVVVGAMALAGCAQTQLRGRVIDQDGVPKRGIEVQTKPSTAITITDEYGHFEIRNRLDDDNNPTNIPSQMYTVLFIGKTQGCIENVEREVMAEGETDVGDVKIQCRKLDGKVEKLEELRALPNAGQLADTPIIGE